MIKRVTEIIEHRDEFKTIYKKFYDKFVWVRRDPWNEYEAPFIKNKSIKKANWL